MKAESKIIDLAEKKEKWTKFHDILNYLSENYDIRYNTIATDVEISKKNANDYKSCNENTLWLELSKKGYSISKSNVISILQSDFVVEYNALKSYFENLPKWDNKTDYIIEYSRFIKLNIDENKEQFEYHFKKWCVRAVKCAMINGYYNKQAFVLSDNAAGQNIGKTFYLNNLCSPAIANYLQINIPDDNSKDAKVSLGQNFIINLDELTNLNKKEINNLKSLFSETNIKARLPYTSKPTNIQRTANFVGSTNNITFLNDETGSVRWLCFVVKSIEQSYSKTFNIDNLWSQAYSLSLDKNFNENLTPDDILKNEIRNEKFQNPTPEKELLHKYFKCPEKDENIEYFTATDVLNELSKWTTIRLTPVGVGRALTALRYNRVKHNGMYCYEVIRSYQDTN